MRVWQLTGLNVKGVGGVEKHIAEVSARLRDLGHEVHVGRTIPPAWLTGPPTPTIIHTHGDLWPNLALFRAKIKQGFIWIHVCHGTSIGRVVACKEFLSISGWRGSMRDFCPVHLADAAVAVGPNALREARMYFRMTLPACVIPNGTDPDVFTPLHQLTLEHRLIYVGRDGDRVKNVPLLLDACESIAPTISGFKLWCAPGINYDYTVHPFVKNLGPLSSPELATALGQCRALVLCSLYEGDPIVLHEAQALGLPIVASDIPQIRHSLASYSNAIFVSPRSVESIAFGLRTAASGPPVTPSPRVRSWAQVARDFEGFYGAFIAGKK